MFRSLMIYLTPVIPTVAAEARTFFGEEKWQWRDASEPLLGTTIAKFKPLLTRVESAQIDNMVEQSKETETVTENKIDSDTISIDDFMKIDLRIALVRKKRSLSKAQTSCSRLRLTSATPSETYSLASRPLTIRRAWSDGRSLLSANLAPRKMRFGTSEGMVLAAGPGGEDIFLLAPDDGASPGMRVK